MSPFLVEEKIFLPFEVIHKQIVKRNPHLITKLKNDLNHTVAGSFGKMTVQVTVYPVLGSVEKIQNSNGINDQPLYTAL